MKRAAANTLRQNAVSALVAIGVHGVVGAAIIMNSVETSQGSEGPSPKAFSVELVSVRSFRGSNLTQNDIGFVSAAGSAKEELPPLSGKGTSEASNEADTADSQSAVSKPPSITNGAGDKHSISSSVDAAEMARFQKALLDHIQNYKGYPERARRAHTEGMVLLRFVMDRQGKVTDAWIESGSGSTALDAEALATIQRAQPLPQIPAQFPDSLRLVLPLTFNLE